MRALLAGARAPRANWRLLGAHAPCGIIASPAIPAAPPVLTRSNWGLSTMQGSELDRKLEAVLKDYQLAQGQKRAASGAEGAAWDSSELKTKPALQQRLVQKVLFICNEEDGQDQKSSSLGPIVVYSQIHVGLSFFIITS